MVEEKDFLLDGKQREQPTFRHRGVWRRGRRTSLLLPLLLSILVQTLLTVSGFKNVDFSCPIRVIDGDETNQVFFDKSILDVLLEIRFHNEQENRIKEGEAGEVEQEHDNTATACKVDNTAEGTVQRH